MGLLQSSRDRQIGRGPPKAYQLRVLFSQKDRPPARSVTAKIATLVLPMVELLGIPHSPKRLPYSVRLFSHFSASSARLSFNTLTRFSPRTPRTRSSVASATSARIRSGGSLRAAA